MHDRFEHHLWDYGQHPWDHAYTYTSTAYNWWPGMLLSALSTVFWVALLIGCTWALLRWVFPYVWPMLVELFDIGPADTSALEILRQRYAAGEIDAVTFEQMRERLAASYPQDTHAAEGVDAENLS